MSKKSEPNFNNMTVFAFSKPILLMCVWTRNTMCDAKRAKKCVVHFLIFATPIRLDTFNFDIQKAFNMSLKLKKNVRGLRPVMHQIDPRKLTEIINETYIVFETPNRLRGWTPNIQKNHLQRRGRPMN
jgi:hypothetical protein